MFQLYVADCGLKELSGHHVGAMRALVQAWGTHRLVFYCNKDPAFDLIAEAQQIGVTLKPFFSTYYYDAINTGHTISELNGYINFLAREYIQLFEETAKGDPAGFILHHTVDWPHLQALGVAIEHGYQVLSGTVRHIVFLSFNPGVDRHGVVTDQRRFLSYRMALGRLRRNQNVCLFASDLEAANALALALPEETRIPVHPCFFFLVDTQTRRARQPSTGGLRECLLNAKVVLYLGHAREEKGFSDLPDVVRMMGPHLGSRGQLLIQFDINNNLSPLDGTLLRALDELRALADGDQRIKLIDAFLPERDFDDLIAESNWVFFNYDSRVYASRSSGLLWQACWFQVPVMVIGDSWLSREARRLNSQTFTFSTLGSLEKALTGAANISPDHTELDEAYRETIFGPIGEFLIRVSNEHRQGGTRKHWISGRSKQPGKKPKVLVVDADVPDPDASGGGYAAVQEMRLLKALGYSVSFATTTGCFLGDQVVRLLDEDIEVLWRPRYQDVTQALVERGHEFDLVYATRYHVAKVLIETVRFFAPQAKLVLNVADLHSLREMRKAGLSQEESAMQFAERVREDEMATLSRVDLVLTYTDAEQAMIESYLGNKCCVSRCPWIEKVYAEAPPYDGRRDIAFLGGYAHAPNVDAVIWFVEAVMPQLRERLPGVRFHVYGANTPRIVESLASDDVIIHGFVRDVSEAFDSCRIFVVPLRYGAGLKGKVAAALARGVPCVLSPVAAEGFFTGTHAAAVVARSAEDWVTAISGLYNDKAAWAAASRAALDYSVRHFRFEDAVRRMAEALSTLDHVQVA